MGCVGSVTEECDNEYDSTWEDEQEVCMITVTKQQAWTTQRNLRAARDMQNYRHRCQANSYAPHLHGQRQHLPNIDFYLNKIPFRPDGVNIKQFHMYWNGDYTKLERVHSYIQWLFPTQEPGVNNSAYVLTPEEIRYFKMDMTLKKRLLKSYQLMLDFYGIQLVSEVTGHVRRGPNWKERFENLNRHTHNNLRITRILKSLGLLGFPHFQAPLVHFFLEETLVKGTLPEVKQSALDYFIFAVLDKIERRKLIKFAFWYFEPKEQFVWCPRRIQSKLFNKQVTRKKHTTAHERKKQGHKPFCRTVGHSSQNSARKSGARNARQSKKGRGHSYSAQWYN